MITGFPFYASYGGALAADYSHRASGVTIATNLHGFAEARQHVPIGLVEAFRLYDNPAILDARCYDRGSGAIFEGRLEDVAIAGDGMDLTMMGYARALWDVPYTALWSHSGVEGWRPVQNNERSNRTPDMFNMDTNNRLYISLKKNLTYPAGGSGVGVGAMLYPAPHGSTQLITGVEFDLAMKLPTSWVVQYATWDEDMSAVAANATIVTASGVAQTRSVNLTFTGGIKLELLIYNNTGVDTTPTEDDGTWYVNITNIRVVTSTTNRISTTFTATRNAGTNVTATVGSTARMYVGQRLRVGENVGSGESVVILSIGSSTQFNATFAKNHNATETVYAHVVYADEIVKDMLTTIDGTNPAQLSTDTTFIQSPAVDLLDELYADQLPADILTYLVGKGDSANRLWEWAVWEGQRLYFRPRASGRSWYVDISEVDLERTLEQLANSVYATYQEPSGRVLRTATSADSTSVARYGLTRRRQADAQTTSSTQAGFERDAALANGRDPIPRMALHFTELFDASGVRWPAYMARATDTFTIRNLPPTLSTSIDRIRTFRATRTTYDMDTDTLAVELESPPPTTAAQIAAAYRPQLPDSGIPTPGTRWRL